MKIIFKKTVIITSVFLFLLFNTNVSTVLASEIIENKNNDTKNVEETDKVETNDNVEETPIVEETNSGEENVAVQNNALISRATPQTNPRKYLSYIEPESGDVYRFGFDGTTLVPYSYVESPVLLEYAYSRANMDMKLQIDGGNIQLDTLTSSIETEGISKFGTPYIARTATFTLNTINYSVTTMVYPNQSGTVFYDYEVTNLSATASKVGGNTYVDTSFTVGADANDNVVIYAIGKNRGMYANRKGYRYGFYTGGLYGLTNGPTNFSAAYFNTRDKIFLDPTATGQETLNAAAGTILQPAADSAVTFKWNQVLLHQNESKRMQIAVRTGLDTPPTEIKSVNDTMEVDLNTETEININGIWNNTVSNKLEYILYEFKGNTHFVGKDIPNTTLGVDNSFSIKELLPAGATVGTSDELVIYITDSKGMSENKVVKINYVDKIAPVLETDIVTNEYESNPIKPTKDEIIADYNARATDAIDGSIAVVVDDAQYNSINMLNEKTNYALTFKATDLSGNVSNKVVDFYVGESKATKANNAVLDLFTDATKVDIKVDVVEATIDAAELLVEATEDGPIKDALLLDIELARTYLANRINAINTVDNLFTDVNKNDIKATTDQTIIDDAQSVVDALPNSTIKDQLQVEIDLAQQILDSKIDVANIFTDATKENIGSTVTQTTLDNLTTQVNLLPDGPAKVTLLADIAIAQGLLDAQSSIQLSVDDLFTDASKNDIKSTTDQAAIDNVQGGIDVLPNGPIKDQLQGDLDLAQQILDSKNDVANIFTDATKENIESSVTQTTLDDLTTQVNLLPDGPAKDTLLADIAIAQDLLDSQSNVQTIIGDLFTDANKNDIKGTTDQAAIDNAQTELDKLPAGSVKDQLQIDIDLAQEILDAKTDVANIFTDATKENIESTVTQSTLDDLTTQVNLLPDGPAKVTLLADIAIAQDLLNNQAGTQLSVVDLFTDASKNDIKATTDQAAIDNAQGGVDALPNGPIKDQLQVDIDLAQEILDAKTDVANIFTDATKENIESTVTQTTLDDLVVQVNLLPDGPAKDTLLADIAIAQDLLNTQSSTQTIIVDLFTDNNKNDIKGTTDQAAIDNAQTELDKLPAGSVKDQLQIDIDLAQEILDAKSDVANIFTDGTKENINITVTQETLDDLVVQVNLLPDGPAKDTLLADIAIAQDKLDAQAGSQLSVEDLFTDNNKNDIKGTTNQAAIDNAQSGVDALPNGPIKDQLQIDIDLAQEILDAKTDVANIFTDATKENIESTVTQTTLDDLTTQVNLLPDGPAKDTLIADIAIAQDKLNKQNVVQSVIDDLFTDSNKNDIKGTTDQAVIDNAQSQIDTLPAGPVKDKLQEDLDLAQQILDSKNDVANIFTDGTKENIDSSVTQETLDNLTNQVSLLPEGPAKETLLGDIAIAQEKLDAQDSTKTLIDDLFTDVDKNDIKGSTDQVAIDNAQTELDKLPAGSVKDQLQIDIDLAQQILDAKNDVADIFTDATKENIESTVTQGTLDDLTTQVNLLPDGPAKDTLLADIAIAQDKLNNQNVVQSVIDDLFTDSNKNDIKETTDQAVIDNTQTQIDTLPAGPVKDKLQEDLDLAQQILDSKNDVANIFTDSSKENINNTVTQETIDAITDQVSLLPEGPAKETLLGDIAIAQDKLDNQNVVQSVIDDLFTDSNKNDIKETTDQAVIDNAQTQIDTLPAGPVKDKLQEDLDTAQQILNSKNDVANIFTDGTKENIDSSVTQETLDNLTDQVSLLPEGPAKETLLGDIAIAQEKLDAQDSTKTLIDDLFTDANKNDIKGTTDQAAIDNAQTELDKLPAGSVKDQLQTEIDLAQQILDAKNDVANIFTDATKENIESTVTQGTLDDLTTQVNLLPEGPAKDTLLADIAIAQDKLNNQNVVQSVIDDLFTDSNKNDIKETTDQAVIDNAQTQIDTLPAGPVKDKLQEDLDLAQQILDSKNDVANIFTDGTKENIDSSVTQETLDNLTDQVSLLPEGPAKETLLGDIAIAQDKLNNQNVVQSVIDDLFTDSNKNDIKETTDQAVIDNAQSQIDTLPAGPVKDKLQEDLDLAQQILDSKNDVANIFTDGTKENIDSSVTQETLDNLTDQVSLLPEGPAKETLLGDIAIAQDKLDKQNNSELSVDDLFTDANKNDIKDTTDQVAIDNAQNGVDALPNGPIKDQLQAEIDVAQQILDAKNDVANIFTDGTKENIDSSVTQGTLDDLTTQVNLLPDGPAKDTLLADIAIAQDKLNNQNVVQSVIDDLFTDSNKNDIKDTTDQAVIDNTQTQIDTLPAGPVKDKLQEDLDLAQQILDSKNDVANIFTDGTKENIDSSVTQETLDNLTNQVSLLPEGPAKETLLGDIAIAQDKLDKQSNSKLSVDDLFTDANKNDIKDTTDQVAIDNAQSGVDALPNGPIKDQLQAEIDVAQQILDSKNDVANIFTDATKENINSNVTQTTLDDLTTQVNLLPDGPAKDTLLADIAIAQDKLNNQNVVQSVIDDLFTDSNKNDIKETTDQAVIDNAQTQIDTLPAGPVKDKLQEDLDTAQQILDSKNDVTNIFTDPGKENIDSSVTQEVIDAITDQVSLLPEGPAKETLLGDLANAQDKLDKQNNSKLSVDDLFTDSNKNDIKDSTSQSTIDNAQGGVNALPNGPIKDQLQAEIDVAQQILDSKNDVANIFTNENKENINENITLEIINTITDQVNLLPEGPAKDKLKADLELANQMLDAKNEVENIFTDGTHTNINENVTQEVIDNLLDKVSNLPNGLLKDELLNKIEIAQGILDYNNRPAFAIELPSDIAKNGLTYEVNSIISDDKFINDSGISVANSNSMAKFIVIDDVIYTTDFASVVNLNKIGNYTVTITGENSYKDLSSVTVNVKVVGKPAPIVNKIVETGQDMNLLAVMSIFSSAVLGVYLGLRRRVEK